MNEAREAPQGQVLLRFCFPPPLSVVFTDPPLRFSLFSILHHELSALLMDRCTGDSTYGDEPQLLECRL